MSHALFIATVTSDTPHKALRVLTSRFGLVVTALRACAEPDQYVLRWMTVVGVPSWYVTISHSVQLSLLPSAGREGGLAEVW